MKKFLTISALFLTFIISCHNKPSELEFEKEVMSEIYPSLIDSIWMSREMALRSSIIKNIEATESESQKELKENCIQRLARIKKDSLKINIIIATPIIPIEQYAKKELAKHFKNAVLPENNQTDTIRYFIDTTKFNSEKNLRVKFVTSFATNLKTKFEITDEPNIIGIIGFSRILFDRGKKYGVLTATIKTGFANAIDYTIFIKKNNNRWLIDKFEAIWIT